MLVLCCAAALSQGTLKPNALFSDHLILQQHAQDPVFGLASPGAEVLVSLKGRAYSTHASGDGRWRVDLPPMEAGAAFTMEIQSENQDVVLEDVKVGEVWLASGQSNMEFPEMQAEDFEQARRQANSDVRTFRVKKNASAVPLSDEEGAWEPSSTESLGRFSAVALSFAREVSNRLGVPVGIINSSWGGTPAEAWISIESMQKDLFTKRIVDRYLSDLTVYPARRRAYELAMQMWINGRRGGENQGFQDGWPQPLFDDKAWLTAQGGADTQAILKRPFEGSVWYRKVVNVPDEWFGKPLRLSLGMLADYDSTYFNGIRVGFTDQATPEPSQVEREYPVAPGMVRRGPNLIAVRVFNSRAPGGMRGPADHMRLGLSDDSATIPLNGEWRFRVEQELDPETPRPHLPNGPGNPTSPAQLFNGMIHPLMPFGIKGVLWYQGESNVGNSTLYGHLFPQVIRDWRARWGEGLFPFYYVQLPNYLEKQPDPGDSSWANLREVQAKALSIPHTAMAVTIDLGEADSIHPKNKREVGRRLALWALQFAYQVPTAYASPTYRSMRNLGDRIEITFSNGSLITRDGKAPAGFALAGADHKFYWANTVFDGSTVTASCGQVPHPLAVRYAWADNPSVNLVNRAGLPAAPFRTDDWPLKENTK